ncbi:ABC transporter ATP-binding protein [Trueperella pyogenes]|uniref:ABC transporter ATP-binding protein n=1 Tax=Trueperella pyogenes TaxID=1661 RepID=UPI0004BC9170|nr:ABC transporter ATP-binding protein [Trueperella pyogenes]MDF2420548.1 ABC transporter ATP-binding protein [Trueperella pyogenes]WHU58530.1 ABC transporter ATP-binding protein [Trueperella pyogenes]
MNTSTLTAQNLIKTYGSVHALAGVDVTIDAGELVAIMGPSGSGKSTLLHVLSGILVPDDGEVRLGTTSITSLGDAARSRLRRERFGFVFQDGQLVPELTARENVALPLFAAGFKRGDGLRRAAEWLHRLGVSEQAKKRPGEMSGGQAQRVAIARAMVSDPAVIFADEPTGALDQATGHEVMQLLSTTARMNGTTLVVVTHDLKVASWCDRLVEIRDGLIHTDRPMAQVQGEQTTGAEVNR